MSRPPKARKISVFLVFSRFSAAVCFGKKLLTTDLTTYGFDRKKSNISTNRGVAQLVARDIWELKVATRSPLQKSEETREKRRKNEHLPFDLSSQKWFDHNFDQFCENYNFISFFTIEV